MSTYVGVAELYRDLQSVKDVDMLEVSSLHAILVKESFKSLIPFAEKFSKFCKSSLFDRVWKKELNTMLHNKPSPSINDLKTLLWEPTLDSCSDFLGKVTTQKVKLSTVQSAFKNCSEHDIHKELTEFCNLYHECVGRCDLFAEENVSQAVVKIKEYFVILQHQEVASLFLQVKDILQLKGDFQDISVIASKVLTYVCTYVCISMHVLVTICMHMTYIYVIFNAARGQ